MRTKNILSSFIAMAIVAVFVGCNNDNDSSGTGQLVVKMTDAPFPSDLVSEANVTVTKIEARQKSGDSESAFITIMEGISQPSRPYQRCNRKPGRCRNSRRNLRPHQSVRSGCHGGIERRHYF